MKRLIPILSLALLLISCEEKVADDLSGTYRSKTLEVSPIRLFTSKGEVTDGKVIASFVKRHQRTQDVFHTNGNESAVGKLEIAFLTDSKAQITDPNGYDARTVIAKDGDIYFEAYTTSKRMNKEEKPLYDKLVKYFPLSSKTTMAPLASGFTSVTEFKHCYYAFQASDALRFPVMSYLFVHYRDSKTITSMEAIINDNNMLVLDPSKSLVEGDSLALQQCFLLLPKL